VAISFIVLCSLIFPLRPSLGKNEPHVAIPRLAVIPATLIGDKTLPPELAPVPPALTVFTSQFLHGSRIYRIGNMLYRWIFGNDIGATMGHARFMFHISAVRNRLRAGPGSP